MKIATSPFVYWGVAVFMPEIVGNLQIAPPWRICRGFGIMFINLENLKGV